MIFDSYSEKSLLCNVSVQGTTSSGTAAFRGDMVITEGEIADAQGRRHPPKAVVKQAVSLEDSSKIKMVAGAVDQLGYLPEFISRYSSDFAEDVDLIFYVSNLTKPFKIDVEGSLCTLIPHDEGAVWTMLMDDLRLEKSDFKGQSAEDKVITMYEAVKDFKPKYDSIDFNEANTNFTEEVVKEARGPV